MPNPLPRTYPSYSTFPVEMALDFDAETARRKEEKLNLPGLMAEVESKHIAATKVGGPSNLLAEVRLGQVLSGWFRGSKYMVLHGSIPERIIVPFHDVGKRINGTMVGPAHLRATAMRSSWSARSEKCGK